MNKIATYLNEHLLGEVSSAKAVRKRYSTDGSVLSITPELVAFPRVTNDIRKIARFSWQLAEKGHPISLTVRGLGGDVTGAAIGKGITIHTPTHLSRILQIVPKDRLVHVQPGVRLNTLNEALRWHGLVIPCSESSSPYDVTIGGAIAGDYHGPSGAISDAIEKMEVVLANGDIIETGRISRRDVSKKLGLQTLEGEVYRKLEALIEDNDELIKQLSADTVRDNTGYKRLGEVRASDGSFDLTPLFIGSQGTLGIITEVVLRAGFYSNEDVHAVILVDSLAAGRDISDQLKPLEPAELTIYDGELFKKAADYGAVFSVLGDVSQIGAVVYLRLNDFSERAQAHKLKRIKKALLKSGLVMIDSTERSAEDFQAVQSVDELLRLGLTDDQVPLPIMDGAFVPSDRREEFETAFLEFATKHHVELPVMINALTGLYTAFPVLKLDAVSDKQKLFKLMTDYAALVDQFGGTSVSGGAEGRLKANATWAVLDEAHASLYEQLRNIFDPFNTLNPDVKQKNELRSLVTALRSTYDTTSQLS